MATLDLQQYAQEVEKGLLAHWNNDIQNQKLLTGARDLLSMRYQTPIRTPLDMKIQARQRSNEIGYASSDCDTIVEGTTGERALLGEEIIPSSRSRTMTPESEASLETLAGASTRTQSMISSTGDLDEENIESTTQTQAKGRGKGRGRSRAKQPPQNGRAQEPTAVAAPKASLSSTGQRTRSTRGRQIKRTAKASSPENPSRNFPPILPPGTLLAQSSPAAEAAPAVAATVKEEQTVQTRSTERNQRNRNKLGKDKDKETNSS